MKVNKMMYTTLIRPIATYGSPLWAHSPNFKLKKLEVFKRKILRRIHPMPFDPQKKKFIKNTTLYDDLKITPINDYITELNGNLTKRYTRHGNKFIGDRALTPQTYFKKKIIFTRNIKYGAYLNFHQYVNS